GSWSRYAYVETASPKNTAPPAAVTVDVVGTGDLDTFSTYGVEACYRFHSFDLLEARAIDLRGGLTGRLVRYHTPNSRADWLAVYWEWPVHFPGKEYFQRIVLIVDSSASPNQLNERSLVSLARTM